jgi:hypothetical protein
MGGLEDDAVPTGDQGRDDGSVRIECKADSRVHDLDVEWMKGAIFEFGSLEAAEDWVAQENIDIPGTLFLADASGSNERLGVQYHVKYSRTD